MSTPTRYRSLYSGQQIDNLLSSVSSKIDQTYIVNDFQTGGIDKVASAELVKTIWIDLQQFDDPNYITSLILSVPDNNLFTDALKSKLEGSSDLFKGVFRKCG